MACNPRIAELVAGRSEPAASAIFPYLRPRKTEAARRIGP